MIQMSGTVAGRYSKLTDDRNHYLDRARECSELTIPSLIPTEGFESSSKLYQPFQSIGARGVNNLASKLLLLLLPPNQPFFRLSLDPNAEQQAAEDEGHKAEIEEALGSYERNVLREIEGKSMRPSLWQALKHLIVGGNVVLHHPKAGSVKVYTLNQYVCRRGPDGELIELIIKESIDKSSLTEEFRALLSDNDKMSEEACDIYTHIVLIGDMYYSHQEVKEVIVPGSDGTYKKDLLPYLALRFVSIDGENYGRGMCEEYQGDLRSLEGLMKAMVETSAASSKVVFLVRPNASTRKRDLAMAENGAIITGNPDDVQVLQVQKYPDMQVVMETVNRIEKRLSYAFLLNTSVSRDAERVTAEEIRFLSQELEASLGGVYSILSQELQLPLVNIIMERLMASRKLPRLPKDTVTPVITTGVEALGRGNDLNKLRAFVGDVVNLAGANPEIIQKLNFSDLLTRLSTGHGIDSKGLVKSEEQMQQEQQQAEQMQQQQMAMQAGAASAPGVTREIAKGAVDANVPQESE